MDPADRRRPDACGCGAGEPFQMADLMPLMQRCIQVGNEIVAIFDPD
jgi:hypothetical protein